MVLADTGTYHLTNQLVNLTILNSGDVIINYYSSWQVTGGNNRKIKF